jgi:hypothetical protein
MAQTGNPYKPYELEQNQTKESAKLGLLAILAGWTRRPKNKPKK